MLALIREPLEQRAQQLRGWPIVVLIVAARVTREQHVQRMMEVVVPLRRVGARLAIRAAAQVARRVVVVLEHEMHRTTEVVRTDVRCECVEEARVRVVGDRVHRVEPQPVEVVFLEPVERVVNEEPAHDLARVVVEVESAAPRRVVAIREELRRVEMQIVSFRAEVVVDDVEQNHEPARVRVLHEALELLGPSVAVLGRKRQHAVIAPVARAGRVGKRHQLDRRDAERRQDSRGERAPRRMCPRA